MKVASLTVLAAALGIVCLLIGIFGANPTWMMSGAILVGSCLIAWSIQNKTIV